ncbi:MAG TPA: thiamine phosphate synthase [Solirubrobacteraceae bacterium]
MIERRHRLLAARLYLVCEDRPRSFVESALRGGVDVVQLRIKHGADEEIRSAAHEMRRICADHGALFVLNDRPDLALAVAADGVHVGQEDMPASDAREVIGPDLLLGLSTHTPEQVKEAAALPVDYIGVGPVHATPTKPGRPAVGLELVRYATDHAAVPFFAICGITAANAPAVRAAGAERIAVVRALTEALDPESAARALRGAIGSPAEPSIVAP